jgi:predicted MPP superfamily phosphohydrolase
VRTKYFGSVMLSTLLAASLIAILLFNMTSQTASANSSPENFTIVALPDTQFYSESYPMIFENQTEWIVQNENILNIVFVAHLGDIVNVSSQDYQWQNADNAMSILDGKVPYGILPGNHDVGTEYERYFPASRYEWYSYWGGSYDSTNKNNYQLFSAGGMDFIALNLQYNPPTDVLSWADNVLSEYSDRRAIISTHSYLNTNGSFTDTGGTRIYNNVVVPENNVFLVLCGHMHGEARRSDNNLENKTVYQLLSDYQSLANGGNGWLRIMKFVPSENTIYVKTYSPYLDQYDNDSNSQFELYYSMNPTVAIAGEGISLWVYVGAIAVIVVIIAVALVVKPFRRFRFQPPSGAQRSAYQKIKNLTFKVSALWPRAYPFQDRLLLDFQSFVFESAYRPC